MTNCERCGLPGIHDFPCQILKLIFRENNSYDFCWGGYKTLLAVGRVNLNKKDTAIYISDFIIFPPYRNHGFATRMIGDIVEIAKQKGSTKLKLLVLPDNIPAINLYEKNDFNHVGVKDKYYVYERNLIFG